MKTPPESDVIGSRFGRLVVIGLGDKNRQGRRLWRCECECGQVTSSELWDLRNGKKTSCGCRKRDVLVKASVTHGATLRDGDPALRKAYNIFNGIKQRCLNARSLAYQNYGGRGISIDPRWRSFENFVADMGLPEPDDTIDRIDVDGPYSPENCRWVPLAQQNGNKTTTIWVELDGERLCLKHACTKLGVSYMKVYKRMRNHGVLFEEVIK